MNKKIILGLTLSMAMAPATSLFAEEIGAGCGLGKEIMGGKTGKGSNIAASVLNTFLIPNTFFMTTGDGMMGCDTSQQVQNSHQRETFVAANMDNLSLDMAKGDGEHLATLAQVMGIDEQDKASFYSLTQERYDALFGSANTQAPQMLSALDSAMLSDKGLAKYVR